MEGARLELEDLYYLPSKTSQWRQPQVAMALVREDLVLIWS